MKALADKSSCVGGVDQVAGWEDLMVTTMVYSGRDRLEGCSNVPVLLSWHPVLCVRDLEGQLAVRKE